MLNTIQYKRKKKVKDLLMKDVVLKQVEHVVPPIGQKFVLHVQDDRYNENHKIYHWIS